jgi:hypothetical protein
LILPFGQYQRKAPLPSSTKPIQPTKLHPPNRFNYCLSLQAAQHLTISSVSNEANEIDPDRKVPTIKVELENGVESRIEVWEGIGTKEQFLCHMINMREVLQGMGLFKGYEEARKRVSDLAEERKQTKALAEVVAEQVDNTPLEADKASLREELARHNEAIKELKAAVAEAKQEQVAAMAVIFSTTANFLRGDGKVP